MNHLIPDCLKWSEKIMDSSKKNCKKKSCLFNPFLDESHTKEGKMTIFMSWRDISSIHWNDVNEKIIAAGRSCLSSSTYVRTALKNYSLPLLLRTQQTHICIWLNEKWNFMIAMKTITTLFYVWYFKGWKVLNSTTCYKMKRNKYLKIMISIPLKFPKIIFYVIWIA